MKAGEDVCIPDGWMLCDPVPVKRNSKVPPHTHAKLLGVTVLRAHDAEQDLKMRRQRRDLAVVLGALFLLVVAFALQYARVHFLNIGPRLDQDASLGDAPADVFLDN